MAKVTIWEETTKHPISLIGKAAGTCWGADTTDEEKNYKRGWDCIKSQHGRTWEWPDVYLVLDHWSARVIREYYTHIGGAPSRLQESTRYVDCTDFKYVIPPSIMKCEHPRALALYHDIMAAIGYAVEELEALGIPREDSAMILPLGMETKVVLKVNLRTLVDMSHQRMCARAYWEYRQLMKDLREALCDYSVEWETLVLELFEPKCEFLGYCPEKHSCGRVAKKSNN
jgi:thymidylate synthase (FAD)